METITQYIKHIAEELLEGKLIRRGRNLDALGKEPNVPKIPEYCGWLSGLMSETMIPRRVPKMPPFPPSTPPSPYPPIYSQYSLPATFPQIGYF